MTVKFAVLDELNRLIYDGTTCEDSFSKEKAAKYTSSMPESDLQAFKVKVYATVERIAGKNSTYYQSLPAIESNRLLGTATASVFFPMLKGCLTALRDAVRDGHLETLESRVRAQVHDDYLLQAKDLLDSGYHVAAMVLIGGTVEDHLSKLCGQHGLTLAGSGSISKYNDACYQASVYDKLVWRRVQQFGDVRNLAAHGKGSEVSVADVEDGYQFAGRFTADHPA